MQADKENKKRKDKDTAEEDAGGKKKRRARLVHGDRIHLGSAEVGFSMFAELPSKARPTDGDPAPRADSSSTTSLTIDAPARGAAEIDAVQVLHRRTLVVWLVVVAFLVIA